MLTETRAGVGAVAGCGGVEAEDRFAAENAAVEDAAVEAENDGIRQPESGVGQQLCNDGNGRQPARAVWPVAVEQSNGKPTEAELGPTAGDRTPVRVAHPEIVARLSKFALDWKATLPKKPNPECLAPEPKGK